MDAHFTPAYWEERWKNDQTGWDIGHPSPPITEYFDQITDKDARILIPGCGNAWEGQYLIEQGFKHVTLLDISASAVEHIKRHLPASAHDHIVLGDFFEWEDEVDYVVEQTFFCALHPSLRADYVKQAHRILVPGGKLVGVLFDRTFGHDHPPFGGSKEEYLPLFQSLFDLAHFEPCTNSIAPRAGTELFIECIKRP